MILFGAVAGIVWSFVFFALVNTKVPALIMLASFVALFIVGAMYAPARVVHPRDVPDPRPLHRLVGRLPVPPRSSAARPPR